ncbi:MAG: cardiolipin synthase [Treponema sp.]|nr:cardiolipin synthase [Treponema sp.]
MENNPISKREAKRRIKILKKTRPNNRLQKVNRLHALLLGRVVLIAAGLLAQFALLIILFLSLENVLTIYLGSGVLISIIFLCYLVNIPGKNEFKIAWLLPVLIAPIFGIILYVLYRTNTGGIRLGHQLNSVKQKSRAVLPSQNENQKITQQFPQIKDLADYIYNTGNFPSYTNTSTEFFPSGEDFFASLLTDLEQAKKFIFIEFFIVEASNILEEIISVLHKKVEQNVEVRILFDSVGSIALSSRILKDYFSVYGIQSKVFLKLIPIFNTGLNCRDHRKIVSIDGIISYTGGINITDEYANISSKRFNYWKDTGIKFTGSATQSFTQMFLQNWNLSTPITSITDNFGLYTNPVLLPENCDLNGSSNAQGLVIPYGDDAYNNHDIAENIYRYIIDHAKKYVHIMTPYVIIDNAMVSCLSFCAQRGIEVEIIVPEHWDHFISFCVGRTFLKNLIANGVKVFTYQKGFVHAKVFTSDDSIATIGSVNLDYRSFYHHFECGAVIYKDKSVAAIEQDFNLTKLDCEQLTMEKYKKSPAFRRIIGWIFRIFAPLM